MKDAVNFLMVRKYDKPVPRYTSYPSVPFWDEHLDTEKWKIEFLKKIEEENVNGLSLYIHLPFCESLCTYCGCNKKITTNHSVEEPYLIAIQKEWLLYKRLMRQTPVVRELHIGGGTPTFFSPSNLESLIRNILKGCIVHPSYEFTIEGHPNNTTDQHLKVLSALGFRRISYGVQDNDPDVQRVINRIQPIENVRHATVSARQNGFTSVNFDLIYGLPLQTVDSIQRTMDEVIELKPDRIAFYSYAHVPWTSKAQRLFDESHLPGPEEKIMLYLKGKEKLTENGYVDIGLDHFSLPTDDLFKAWKNGRLHRNFMGYTTQDTKMLLGLGVSSISDLGSGFAQNEKNLHDYYSAVNNGLLPLRKGYFLSDQDVRIRKHILDICCKGETEFWEADLETIFRNAAHQLTSIEADGLIEWNGNKMKLTAQGHYFIRNICAALDQYVTGTDKSTFSKAI